MASDNYLIATFHYYKPNDFTKSSRDDKDQEIWGSSADKSQIDIDFNIPLNWAITNNIPMLLGEFGADNTGGYNYDKGDLNTISTNATGYADGGPENASRVEFHRYLAEKAIALGFAFTAWDAGPESNKTIHKRTDAASTVNYNIANFSVTSYDPKVTTPSTVIDTSVWVEDVKDALLSSVLNVDKEKLNFVNISVYPNPSSNFIAIKSAITIDNILLFNTTGSLILKAKNTFNAINIFSLSDGIYILKIELESGLVVSKKLVVLK